MENQIKSVGLITIKTTKTTCELTGFDYNPPFSDELKNIGGEFDSIRFVFIFQYCSDKMLEQIIEICNYYYTPQKHYTSGQKNLIKKIESIFEGCSNDFIFRKDNDGMSFIDLNEVCGTPQQIASIIKENKINVIKTTFRRIYISN